MASLSDLVTALSAISSIAIIAGAGFVVVQLRQNSATLNSSLRQEKQAAAFSMLERLTDEAFARRRANFYRVIEKYKKEDWKDFDNTADDFEVRNYAYLYELYGQFVKAGMIEFKMVAEMLQYLAILDWKEFEPVSEHYRQRWDASNWWANFQWLAAETEKYMSKRDSSAGHVHPDLTR